MQILFIREEREILNFLAGLHAEALMPNSNLEVKGISENSFVTVICSGEIDHYAGTIISIDSGYAPDPRGKWLGVKFLVQRNDLGTSMPRMPKSGPRTADA